jgi:hypothetical protein
VQKQPKTFETCVLIVTCVLVVYGVRASPSTTLVLVSILSTNVDVGPAKDPDMLDNILEVDPKRTTLCRRPKPSELLSYTGRL